MDLWNENIFIHDNQEEPSQHPQTTQSQTTQSQTTQYQTTQYQTTQQPPAETDSQTQSAQNKQADVTFDDIWDYKNHTDIDKQLYDSFYNKMMDWSRDWDEKNLPQKKSKGSKK